MLLFTACQKPEDKAKKQLAAANYQLTIDDFVKAAGKGDLEAVRNFLIAGADIDGADSRAYTALIMAAEQGHTGVVEELLAGGARTDLTATDGWTALMMAAYQNHPEIVKVLLKYEADPTLRDSRNWTALMKGVFQGHTEVVTILAPGSPDELDRALMLAALKGHTGVAGALLDAGANINGRTEDQQTALMFAAMNGNLDTTNLLLAKGADTRALDKRGNTAGLLALQRGHVDLSRVIENTASKADGLTPVPAGTSEMTEVAAIAPSDAPSEIEPLPVIENSDASGSPDQGTLTDSVAEIPAAFPGDDSASLPAVPEVALAGDLADLPAMSGDTTETDVAMLTGGPIPPSATAQSDFVFVEYKEEPMPFVLAGVSGNSATVRFLDNSGREVTVSNGETIPGTPYRASRINQRESMTKENVVEDLSQMVAIHTATNEEVLLVRDLPTRSPSSYAVISDAVTQEKVQVQVGREFSLPNDPNRRFIVLDIGPDQVMLQETPGGSIVTVSSRK